MADVRNINGKNIKDTTARNDIANLKIDSHSHTNKAILDTITQEKISSWNSDKTTFNDFSIEQTATEKILKFKGVEIFRCSLQVPGSSGATTYSVTYNLSNCSSDVKTSSITSGSSYSTTITANSGYTMSSITVTMGGTNITSTVVSGNRISIPNVTGNIVITASTTTTTTNYSITRNLSNCSCSNSASSITSGSSYTSTLSPNDGYTISSITVTMGGVDVTNTVVNDNNINILVVEGNIVITAIANSEENTPSDSPIGDVSVLSYRAPEVPQITHYYYPGKQKVSSNETIIPIYFSDYYQREYYYEDTSLRFNLRIDVDGNVRWINNLPAGDHDISLGILSVGEHRFSFEVTQVGNGLRSQRLFNSILIVDDTNDITPAQTYNVTSDDLSKHNITLGLTSSATKEQMSNNRNGMTSMLAEIHDKGYRKIILPENSIIRINGTENDEKTDSRISSHSWAKMKAIQIPTNTTVDLNGSTIKLHPYDDRDFGNRGEVYNFMIVFANCIDSHLINGTIEGDYFERQSATFYKGNKDGSKNGLDGGNGEHDHCISIDGGRYCTIDNLTITKITGYNCQCGRNPEDLTFVNMCVNWGDNQYAWANGNNKDVDINTGEVVSTIDDRCTSDFIDISKLVPFKTFSAGKWLTDYPSGSYYEVLFSFYDANKVFIESFVVYQAREVDIPANSKFVRVTFNGKYEDLVNGEPDFYLLSPYQSEYHEWNNIEFVDNRTCCNPNLFKHLRVYNCHFTRSGQSITPVALDAEDGGNTMQDLFIEECSIKEVAATQTGDAIICGGLNAVIQNNTNFCWGTRGELIGATMRNNVSRGNNCGIEKGWRTRNTIRCYDNEFKGWRDNRNGEAVLSLSISTSQHEKDNQIMIKNCKNINHANGWTTYDECRKKLIFKDCDDIQMGAYTRHISNTFYINSQNISNQNRTGNSIFDKCLFTRKTTGGTNNTNITSFNYGNAITSIGTYNDCTFDFINSTTTIMPDMANAFVKGEFNNCTFKTPMILKLLYANTMGDIKFNNCKFEAELTLDLRDTKVQFNGCTFNGISYLNNGQANSQFN